MQPLAGAAPARFSYKENQQAAAKRQKKWWAATVLPRVLRFKRPLHHSLMLAAQNKTWKGGRGLARWLAWFDPRFHCLPPTKTKQSEGWSQSRVLPSAELAYETGLSAGSIAVWAHGQKWSPHPELHWVGSPTKRVHHWKCFEGCENGRRETTCTSKAA